MLFPRDLDLQLLEVEEAQMPRRSSVATATLTGHSWRSRCLSRAHRSAARGAGLTMRRARLALLHAGLLDDTEALAAIPDETASRGADRVEYAQDVERQPSGCSNSPPPWAGCGDG